MKKSKLKLGSVLLFLILNLILDSTAFSRDKIEIISVDYPNDRLKIEFNYHGKIEDIEGLQFYLSSGISNDLSEFKLIADIKINNDSIILFKNNKSYVISIKFQNIDLETGVYTLFMQSYIGRAIIGTSNYFVFRSSKQSNKTVKFISTPDKYAYVGEEYVYTARAESENNELIIYELVHSDAKVDFDRNTGVFKWIPEDIGRYRFVIRAFVPNKPSNSVIQDFEIIVFYCNEPATLNLKVYNNLDKPVETAFAQLFSVDNSSNKFRKIIYDAIIDNGVAVFDKVDKGTYYLLVYGREFRNVYYKDATEIIDATPIEINCKDVLNLEMKINQFDNDNFYFIKGRVTREESGEPIHNAMIEFIAVDANRKPFGRNYWAYTDADGFYQILIPGKMLTVMKNFICRAIEFVIDDKTSKIINTIYYDQKKDILEADLLVLPGPDTIVNFQIPKPYDYTNSLAGEIIDENNQPLKEIWIVAYMVDDWINNSKIKHGYTIYSNTDGKFQFNNLYPGEYILLAVDLSREYIPGYYKEGQFLAKSWEEATRIELSSFSKISDLVLKMQKLQENIGNSKYKGRISKKRNGTLELKETTQSLEPISGAMIYAIDKNNKIRKFEFSDNQGNFVLDQLSEGYWEILFDKIGYTQIIKNIELSSSEVKEENILLESKTTSVVTSNTPYVSVYPQPAKDKINVLVDDLGQIVNIKIIDVLGKEIFNQQYHFTTGSEAITIALPQISSGVYIFYIEGNRKVVLPLLIN